MNDDRLDTITLTGGAFAQNNRQVHNAALDAAIAACERVAERYGGAARIAAMEMISAVKAARVGDETSVKRDADE